MLSKIRHFVPKHALFSLYHSIFSSHLTYGCQIWFETKNAITNQITKLQNKAIRLINFKNSNSNAKLLYNQSNILQIDDHTNLLNCLSVYECLHLQLPPALKNFVTRLNPTICTRAAEADALMIPNVETTHYGLQSVKYCSISTWNGFQRLYHQAPLTNLSKYKLKNLIKDLYINSYTDS